MFFSVVFWGREGGGVGNISLLRGEIEEFCRIVIVIEIAVLP